MTDTIHCDEHGQSAVTIVCKHIVESLRDGRASGFLWSIDDDGEYQATCDACDSASAAMSDESWELAQIELGRVLCFGCFSRAANLNRVDLGASH